MLEKGKVFSSGIFDLPKRYPVLSDGGQVHSAEVAVQAVEYYYEKLNDPFEAVKQVQQVLTNEAASSFADTPIGEYVCFGSSANWAVNCDGGGQG